MLSLCKYALNFWKRTKQTKTKHHDCTLDSDTSLEHENFPASTPGSNEIYAQIKGSNEIYAEMKGRNDPKGKQTKQYQTRCIHCSAFPLDK